MNNIQDLISQIGDLPTLPAVASRINREMASESLNAKLLGEIIIDDTALAAKILRLANSAFYGLQKQVTTLNKAVMILGFNTVKNLALSVSIYSFFKERPGSPIDVKGLWLHSLGCAVAAKIITEKLNKKLGEDAFLFGILHDIGKIVSINAMPQDYEKILLLIRERHMPEGDAEMEVMGFNHQRLGSQLLEIWKFPDNIVQAVKYHHDPQLKTAKIDPQMKDLIRALFLGNQMAKALHLGKSTYPVREEIPKIVWQSLNIKRSQINDIAGAIRSNYALLLEAWDMEGKDDV
ncbi:MAG: HDOD domain-containing protein [Desulfobulbaceae bacterium]|nr:HDOD domain-containing protein [Desulfobulbaceae bacterium]